MQVVGPHDKLLVFVFSFTAQIEDNELAMSIL